MTATPHLTPGELIDLAEGGNDGRGLQHLETCAGCREEFDGIVSMLAAAGRDRADEPSPLFWQHLSRRVADAIDAGAGAPAVPWWRRSGLWRPSVLAAAAVVVAAMAVTVTWRAGEGPRPVMPAPASTPVAMATGPVDEGSVEAPDPTWDVVTVLSAELGGDDFDPAGFEGAPGTIDRAVEGLSADEQGELVKLLEEALAKRPS